MTTRIGYHSLISYADGPLRTSGRTGVFTVMAAFGFEQDMAPLLPYVNAVAERAELFETPAMVRFVFQDVWCAVYSDRCIASPLAGKDQVRSFTENLIGYLTGIRDRMDDIVPRHQVFRPGSVPRIFKLLPGTNCGDCGVNTCLAFAAMVARQMALPDLCPHMSSPLSQTFPVLDDQGREVDRVTLDLRPGGAQARPLADGSPTAPGPEAPEPTAPPNPDTGRMPSGILPEPLSPREMEVLSLMGEGHTNPQISKLLKISPHTVKSHVIHIFNKLGVNHRTQAVVWAARNGMI